MENKIIKQNNSEDSKKTLETITKKNKALKIVDFINQKSPKLRYKQFKKEIMEKYNRKTWEEVSLEDISKFFNYKFEDLYCKKYNELKKECEKIENEINEFDKEDYNYYNRMIIRDRIIRDMEKIRSLPLMYATLLKTKDLSEIKITQEDRENHPMTIITNNKDGNKLFQKTEDNIDNLKLQEIKHSYPMEFLYLDDIFLSTEANRKENKNYLFGFDVETKDGAKPIYTYIKDINNVKQLFNNINDNNVSALAYYLINSSLTRKMDWSLFRMDNIAISNKLNINCFDYLLDNETNYKFSPYKINEQEIDINIRNNYKPYCFSKRKEIYHLSEKDEFNKLIIALFMTDSHDDIKEWAPANYQIINDILLNGIFKANASRKEFLTATKKILLDKAVIYFRRLKNISNKNNSSYNENEKMKKNYDREETLYELNILSGMLRLTCDIMESPTYKNENDKDIDEQIKLINNILNNKIKIEEKINDIEVIPYNSRYGSNFLSEKQRKLKINKLQINILQHLTFEEPITNKEREKRLQNPLKSIAIKKDEKNENKIFIPYKLVDKNGITVRNTQESSTFTMKEKYNDYLIKEIEKEIGEIKLNIEEINKIISDKDNLITNKHKLNMHIKKIKEQYHKLRDNRKNINHQYDEINKISKSNSNKIMEEIGKCITDIQEIGQKTKTVKANICNSKNIQQKPAIINIRKNAFGVLSYDLTRWK